MSTQNFPFSPPKGWKKSPGPKNCLESQKKTKYFGNQKNQKNPVSQLELLISPSLAYFESINDSDSNLLDKIDIICHITCQNWSKNAIFFNFYCFRVIFGEIWVKILKLHFLKNGHVSDLAEYGKMTVDTYTFIP